jgi:hypothetical protein
VFVTTENFIEKVIPTTTVVPVFDIKKTAITSLKTSTRKLPDETVFETNIVRKTTPLYKTSTLLSTKVEYSTVCKPDNAYLPAPGEVIVITRTENTCLPPSTKYLPAEESQHILNYVAPPEKEKEDKVKRHSGFWSWIF